MSKYWYRTCPICDQGNLIIDQDVTNRRMVLHCDECDWVFLTEEQVTARRGAFNAVVEQNIELEPATEVQIMAGGWQRYARFHD
jgi:transcription elongation factor Elf1